VAAADENTPPIARWLTVPGRLLLIVIIVSSAGGIWWYVESTIHSFPSGRYPIILWAVPVLVVAALLFFGIAAFLEKIGIRIYQKPPK